MLTESQKFVLAQDITPDYRIKVQEAFGDLFEEAGDDDLLFISESDDDLQELKELAKKLLEKFDNFIFVATGASYTIPKMVIDFAGANNKNFHFLRNFDSFQLHDLMQNLSPKKTFIIAISKSGETLEVLANILKLHEWMHDSKEVSNLEDHFLAITEAKVSQLFTFAETIKCQNLEHPNVGGRFAVFTKVGLFPALLAGFDIELVLQHAKEAMSSFVKEHKEQIIDAITFQYYHFEKGKIPVLLSYGEFFNGFNEWYKQLIAESLGKDQKGIIPIVSTGAYDQHIQLQLFLDGTRDLFFTILGAKTTPQEQIIKNLTKVKSMDYLAGCSFQDILAKNKSIITEMMKKSKLNLCLLEIEDLSEKSFCELVVYKFIELMVVAYLKGINPFGQPAVENIKVEIKKEIEND